jgi:cytidylate kinase
VVTLDGPAGVGKSTLARLVAERLGVAYLDTGAMFRATALALGDGAWDWPEERLRERLAGLSFTLRGAGGGSSLELNGRRIGPEIRTEQVGMWGSNLARLPVVREFLKQAQQAVGRASDLVAEGRDMGTVVFPDAGHKFFLDADPDERARRRWLQLRDQGQDADLAELARQIRLRDDQDRNRAVAPLRPAEDAVIIDTTHLSVDGVFEAIIAHFAARA